MEIDNNIVNYLEDKDVIFDNNWYYHYKSFDKEKYNNILSKGLIAPYFNPNHKGDYKYVYTSKANDEKYSSFTNNSIYPGFILNNLMYPINAYMNYAEYVNIAAHNGGFHNIILNICSRDEYQIFERIEKEKIIGIIFNTTKIITYSDLSSTLEILIEIEKILEENNYNLPILDYYTKKEINKEKIKSLYK